MRVLIISDIHANLTALEAVITAAGKVDAAWCLGDLVGYGPDPNECINLIRSLPNLICLVGNHDAAAIGNLDLTAFNRDASLSARWMQTTLSASNLQFLHDLPEKIIIEQVTLTHGSPRNPIWEYILDTYAATQNFTYFDTQLCFVGHTHLPVAYLQDEITHMLDWKMTRMGQTLTLSGRAILNPGSVGQPRDHDPRAAYAIFYPENKKWEPFRVDYEIASVQQRIYNAGLPHRHALRLAEGW
jgi:predicted phosphodiesterase